MYISCVICSDVFTGLNPDETIYSTQCGHLFHHACILEWFASSKSCPQCRHKTTEKNIIRIYFNNSTVDSSGDEDPSLLKYRVDSLEFQLKMSQEENRKFKEEQKKTHAVSKGLRKEIKAAKLETINAQQEIHDLKNEITTLKTFCKDVSGVKLENEELKRKLKAVNVVDMIINGSVEEAECVVNNTDIDIDYLRVLVKHFKQRISKLEAEHRSTEKENMWLKTKFSKLSKVVKEQREQIEISKRLENLYSCKPESSIGAKVDLAFDSESPVPQKNVNSQIRVDEKILSPLGNVPVKDYLPSPILIEDSPVSNIRISKPNPVHYPKFTSLLGGNQPKFSLGRIPKLSSSSSGAPGDDVFHPTKYSNGKITKKPKKKLSAAAISGVQNSGKIRTTEQDIRKFM